ncbi:MAG: 50S ribosomal protein L17 [bacterium]
MRHLKKGRKFGRKKGQRQSFIAGLLNNLIMEEGIMTTEARAKEIRPRIEKLITIAKKNDLSSLRLLCSRLPEKAAFRLYYDIAPRYTKREGGYVRVVKTAEVRKRDSAPKTIIEFVK